MCVSSPVYPVIIGNVKGACQMKADNQREAQARTSGGNNNDDDNQGGDMPSWMFRESNRGKTVYRDSKKKPAQIKKNDNCATEDIKVPKGTTEGNCITGPVLTMAQVNMSDKIHPLRVKKAMSSVDKTTIEDLQKKNSTLKKCYSENRLLERTMLESST